MSDQDLTMRETLYLFQSEVLLQCRFVDRAVGLLNGAVNAHDREGIFFALQALLNAAASISKAFWGSNAGEATRRGALRDSFGVDDASPLKLRKLRNSFEHLDERLDSWARESTRHNLLDMFIGPFEAVEGLASVERFRQFDPQFSRAGFWETEVNIRELVLEVHRIGREFAVREDLAKGL